MPPTSTEVLFLREQLKSLQEKYDVLVQAMLAWRRQGAGPETDVAIPVHDFALPTDVRAAIWSRTDPESLERREMTRRASELLSSGWTAADVAQKILVGEEVEV